MRQKFPHIYQPYTPREHAPAHLYLGASAGTKKKKKGKGRVDGQGNKTVFLMRSPRGYRPSGGHDGRSDRCSRSRDSEEQSGDGGGEDASEDSCSVASSLQEGKVTESGSSTTEVPLLRLPACLLLPKTVTWIPLPPHKLWWAEDQDTLSYLPYFGDDDTTGFDMSDFQQRPGEAAAEVGGELAEALVLTMLDRWEQDPGVRKRLGLQESKLFTAPFPSSPPETPATEAAAGGVGTSSKASTSAQKRSNKRRGSVSSIVGDSDEEGSDDDYHGEAEGA